ncbi:MAG TPA: pentapeptide repeat-containing protein, partial [Pseudomonas sp.]
MSPLLLLPLALLSLASHAQADDDGVTVINGCRLEADSQCPAANLRGADLRHLDLRRINLAGADLSGADLRHAKLDLANLEKAKLHKA